MTLTQPFPTADRSEFCPICGQHFACADCTATQCNFPGERPHERHMLQGRDRRWNVDADTAYFWIDEVDDEYGKTD